MTVKHAAALTINAMAVSGSFGDRALMHVPQFYDDCVRSEARCGKERARPRKTNLTSQPRRCGGEVRQTTIQPGQTTVRRRSGKRASIRTVRPRGKTEW